MPIDYRGKYVTIEELHMHNLEEHRRLDCLKNKPMDLKVLLYIRRVLKNAKISINDLNNMKALLMSTSENLNSWCYQSTAFLSIFFRNDDKVVRGSLKLYDGDDYLHSWIELSLGDDNFVFDPALSIVASKDDYYRILYANVNYIIPCLVTKKYLYDLFIKNNRSNKFDISGSCNNIYDPFYQTRANADIKFNEIGEVEEAKIEFHRFL
jgi:hypothetical protein